MLALTLQVEPQWAALQAQLTALNIYSVDFRYPGKTAGKADAKDALRDCREVRRVVRTAFGLPI